MKRWRRQLIISMSVALALAGVAQGTGAGDPSMISPSYSINESELGGTASYNSTSPNFNFAPNVDDGGSTLGDTFAGNSASPNYQTGAGFNTTAQPGLSMVVGTSSVNLGALSTTVATTATATFDVTDYTSYGYVVQVIGTPPSNSGHPLAALATDTASATGFEQFGINLRLNSSPVAVGTDPVQLPSANFSYGVAGDGATGTFGTTRPYTIPNKYRYSSGETIASAPKSSGDTHYTISFLANISNTTPGGAYSGGLSIVATGTY